MLKNNLLKIFWPLLAISIFLLVLVPKGFAAEMSLNSPIKEVRAGDQLEIFLLLNTKEGINALEGKVAFPKDFLQLKEIREGNSIINFWVESPKAISATEIIFSGIIPGAYQGNNGLIFSLIFQCHKEGKEILKIKEARTLLNDGLGTQAELSISDFTLNVLPSTQAPPVVVPGIEDNEPPELFAPEIVQDPNIFKGQYFLVFSTKDKGSGIDYYEIREGKRHFVIAQSPYLLLNQDLDESIIIKAIDKSGNIRLVTLPAQKALSWYKKYAKFIIIIGVVLVLLLIRRIIKDI
ncbi:hypothetical protein KKF32_02580 [Patescibacteria group bacterium]|nr:hypothetical protein [Patescibacteria group bacterium]